MKNKIRESILLLLVQAKPALAGSLIPLKINKKMKQKDKRLRKLTAAYES